jgi:hypothetical protein
VSHQVQEWLFAAALLSSLASMAGLVVAVASQRSQLAVQIMLQYSEKFRMMLLAMPLELLATRHDRHHALEPSPELSRHALTLFFILLELHYLRERRYLPMGIWNLWLPSVRSALQSSVFVSEWEMLRVDFLPHHPSFCRFIDSMQVRSN